MYRECLLDCAGLQPTQCTRSVQGVSVGLCRCTALTVYRECLSDSVDLQPTQCTGSVQGVSVGLCRCTAYTVYKECIGSFCWTVLAYNPHSVQGMYRECLSDCVGVQPTQCKGN